MKLSKFFLAAFLITGCSAELPHEAPFDALSPFDKQAKGQVTGNIRLEGESDHSQVTVQLQSAERTYSVDTAADGAVKLTGVVPGTYELSIRTRYFQPFSDMVQVALGEEFNLGVRELPLNRAAVFGSALLEKAGNVMSGGVMVTLAKTDSIRSSSDSAGAPAFKRAAAETTAETYTTISSAAGQYQFSDVPAGRYDVRAAGGEGEEATVAQVTVTGEGNVRLDDIVLRPLTGFFEIVGQANGGDSSAYTTVPTVQLKLTAANAQKMKIAESSDGSADGCNLAGAIEQTYAGLVNFTFAHGAGRKLVCVQYIDLEGKETPPIYGTIVYDNAAPSPVNVLPITNNGFSKTQNVLANLSAIDDLSGVAAFTLGVSPAAALTAVKQPFQSTIQINFPGAGTQTTYVRVFDAAGNASDAVEVSVVVDTAAPVVSSASVETLTGTAIGHNDTTRESRVVLRSLVSDLTPLEMQVTTTGSFAGLGWEPYSAGKIIDLTAASSTVAARVRDSAGNVVELLSGVTVNLDNQAPTATFTLDSGTPTNNLTVSYTVGSSESGVMQVSADVGFAGAAWMPIGAGTIVLSAGDGVRSIYARTRDAAGNTSDIKTLQVVVDRTPPQNAGFTISSGEVTNSRLVSLAFSGVDIDAVRVAEDACAGSYATHGGTGSLNLASVGDGVKTVAVQFRDTVGNESACFTKTVTLDETAPVVNSFLINNNSAAVTTRSVTLTIDTDADEMQLSESSAFSGASWQPVTSTVNFTLSAGEGSKTVYARFRDAARNPAGPVQDSILVDTVAPVFHAVSGPASASVTTVTLALSAAGADLMRLSENADFSGANWVPFLAGPTFYLVNTEGAHTVYIQLADNAGNESTVRTHSVSLDSVGPDTPIVSIVGGQYSKVPGITVQTLADGAAEVRIGQQADLSDGLWVPYAQLKAYSLVGGEGAHTVYVQVRDAAQNVSAIASATVTLDSIAPVVNMRADDGLGNLITESNSTRYYMRLWVTDATDTQVQFAASNSFSGVPFEAVSTLRTWDVIAPTASGGAPYNTYVKVSDAAGNSTTVGPITVLVDTVGPTAPALSFAASTVSSPTVTANFSAVNADYVEISEDISFLSPTVLTYRTSEPWTFTNTDDGVKNLYVRFADNLGNYSAVAAAGVTLDQTAPENTAFSIAQASPTKQSTLNLSLSAIGATQLSVSENSCASTWEAYAQTKAHILSNTTEGNKTIAVRFRDAVGNVSPCMTQTVYFDNNAPTLNAPAVSINYGAASTSNGTVTVSFDVVGATQVKVSEDSSLADAAWMPYTATRTFGLSAGNGTKTVYAIFRDDADNQTAVVNDTIVLDTTPISTPFVTIQADVTSVTTVQVNFAASNIDEMWYSEQSDFSTGAWEPYVATKNVTFSGGDGTKTLYAKFRKTSGAESTVASDSFVLDTTPPILPNIRVNNGATVVSSAIVTLNLSAVDETSGLGVYRINTTNSFGAVADKGYQPNDLFTLSAGDGTKTVWVIYGDRARNYSAPASVSVVLDSTAPAVGTVDVQRLDGSTIANGATVRDGRIVLASTVSDLTALEMQVTTNGSYAGLGWEPYNPSKVIDLTAASSTISARVRDAAGKTSDLVSGFTVNLDNQAPTATFSLTSSTPTNDLTVAFTVSSSEAGEMQVSTDVGFAGASWETIGSGTRGLAAGDGVRSLYARTRDAAGNVSDIKTLSVVIDRTPPQNAAFSIASGAFSNSRTLSLTYSGVEIEEVRVAEDACGGTYASPGGMGTFNIASVGDGVKTVAVQFRDAVGNETACLTKTVTLDETAPVINTFAINNNDATATVRTVTLSIDVVDADEMQISESSTFSGASWVPVTTSVNYTLSAGEGSKTVFARFRDNALNTAGPVQDAILIDTLAPVFHSVTGALSSSVTNVTLTLNASGADLMRLSETADFSGASWVAYNGLPTFYLANTQGAHTIYIQLADTAGNESTVRTHGVTLDSLAPDSPIVSIVGGAFTKVAGITVQTLADGAAEIRIGQQADLSDGVWVPYTQLKAYSLVGGEGAHTVYVQVRDAAQNASAIASATVTLDSLAPVVNMRADDGLGNLLTETNSTRYYMRLWVTDATDAQVQFAASNSFSGVPFEAVSTLRTWDVIAPTASGGASYNTYVKVSDAAGNSTTVGPITVLVDTVGPTAPALSFAASTVSSPTVTANFSAVNADYVEISEDISFLSPTVLTYRTSEPWTFTNTDDGVKNLYVRFADNLGNYSAVAAAGVTLDQTAPENTAFSIAQASPTKQSTLNLTLSAIGATQMSIGETVCGSAWESYAQTKAHILSDTSEGNKTIAVRFRDAVGNVSACLTQTVFFDDTPPTLNAPAISLNYGAASTSNGTVTVAFDVLNATEVKVSEDSSLADAAWLPYTATRTFSLSAGNGTKTVYAVFRDAADNQTSIVNDTIVLDTTPISVPFVTIQAEVTSSTNVLVNFAASNIDEMWYSEQSDFSTGAWEPYVGTKSVNFSGGDGTKTLYAKFRKSSGAESVVASDSYVLDTAAPILPSVRVNNGASVVSSSIVTLNLSAVDETSGLAYYQINAVDDFSAAVNRTYQLNDLYTLAGGDGAKSIWVRYADRARNFGAPVSTTIMLDTSAPLVNSVAVKQLDGTAITTGATVRENRIVLASDISDLTTLEMQVSTSGTYVGAAWEPYSPNKAIDLIGASTTIQARVRDQAGLITDLVSGFTVNLDNTAPVVSFVRTSPSPANSPVVTFALSANETVEFQISEDPNFASASWVASAPADHTLSAGEGFRTLYARARDAAGNFSENKSITVTLDTVAPLVSKVSIDEGAYSATRSIQLTLFATGADTMKLAESSDLTAVSAQPYATITAFDLSDSDGAKTVYVQFQDLAGNASATYPLAVTLDRAAPGVPTVVLNGGAAWANNRLVSVGVTADASAIEMQVSEDPLFGNAAWQPFNGSFSHTLQSVNDGNKQLLVRLRDRAGNVSVAGTANIQLDTEAPSDAFLSKSAHPFDYANNTTLLMNLGASAADYMRVSTDGTFDTETWRAMAATTSVTVSATDGLKTVYAQFRDQANNLSQIVQASFFLDTQAPEAGTLAFAQGSYTNQRDVFLQLNASGADFYQISTTTANLAVQPRQPMQPGRPVTLADSDGTHTYYVRFLDRAENVSAVESASILLDRAVPVAGGTPIVLNNGDAYTQQSFVTVTLDVAGATEMQMHNQPFFDNGGWEPVTTSTTWFLENGDGPKTVWVRFRDAAGNVTPAYSDSIHLDQRAPDVSRVVLNDGRDYTNSLTLTLRSEARDVTEMRYGTDASFSTGSGWVAFQENQSVVVAAGDGVKTIYAQFRDAALNTSAIFSDSITLDQTEPESPSLSINSGAAFTREPSGQVQLTLSASDELAGIAGMQLSNVSAAFPSAVSLPYAPSRNWNIDTLSDGTKTVWVRFYDRAGNFSTAVSDTIVLDRAAPAGASVVINGNAVYATTNIVTLALAASDANGVSEMILSTNPGFGDGFWQPFTSSSTFVLPAMDGNRFVHVKFRDAAGNESAPVSDDIQLDTLAPQFDNLSVPAVTSNHVVSVQLFAPPAPNATEMRLSEDSLFTGADWVAFSNGTTFTVSAGDGSKTIYAQLRDSAGHTSVVRSATVAYDTTGPDMPAIRIRQGTYISNAAVDVEIFADGATALLISQWAPMTDATPQPFNPVKAFTFTGDDGVKTVYVKVRDGAGNYSSAATAYAVLDRAAPGLGAGAVVINSGAPTTNSSFVTLAFSVTGATELQVAEDLGFGGASWAPYSSSRAFTLSQGDGVKTVYARFRDASGNIAGPVNDTIQLDTRAPANPFINIAASVTNVASVDVALSASDADQMKISLSPDFSGASWEAYAANKTVALSGADGQKTVYAKFRRSASGHDTSVVSDGVLLDRVGPTDAVAELSSAITYVTSTSVSLRLSAVDSLSGVQSVEISESPIFFDKDTLSMRSIAGYTLRIPSEDFHPLYVRYLDKAGNYSNTVTLGVIYDVTPPSGTIQVAGGAERINSQFVTVTLSSADTDIQKVRIANDAGAVTEFNYSESLIWAIKPIQDTPTEVNVRFVDIAGNASAPYSDIVTYDTAPPVVSSFDLQMEVSTTALTLQWDLSYMPNVTGYTWYRHLNGAVSLGGSVGSAVTSVTVLTPLTGEEYSVAAWYADGLRSALSSPAVENSSFQPAKGILLVDDAAGAQSVVDDLKPLLDNAGFTYDTVTVAAGSDGPASTVLLDYQIVVWSSGESAAPTLTAYDRESLQTYLSAGGNLVYLGSEAASDSDTATFLKRWIHTGRVETDLPSIERIYVEAGDIGGALGGSFLVGPAIEDADAIYSSPLSDDFLSSGKPLGVRYPLPGATAPYRASWVATPTSGLYNRHVLTFNTDLVDIPVTGATLRLLDTTPLQNLDDAAVELDLPFNFQFGTVTSDKIFVSSNGIVTFGQPNIGPVYPIFPTTDTVTYPGSIIAAHWVDMEPGGEIYYTATTEEVIIVWNSRPVTAVTHEFGFPTVVTTYTSAALYLYSDFEFIMYATGDEWIGQIPNVDGGFMDETGLGFELPRDTMHGCCDSDSPAIAVSNYRGTIAESVWLERLVRWTAAPSGITRIAPRSFAVASNVVGATQMRVSIDGALDSEGWIAYDPNLPITGFSGGDGAKTVQVVFMDEAGNLTGTYSDTENLDTDAPRVTAVFLTDPGTGSNAYSRNRTITLQVLGTASNVDFMRVSESSVFVNAGWVPYVESSTFTLSEGDGAKQVYVWLRDANGNISAPAAGSIMLDVVAPTTVASGSDVARQAPIFINTSYTESTDPVTWSTVDGLGTDTQAYLSYLSMIDLDFSFPYYGRGYSRIIAYPNGVLQVGNLEISGEAPMPMDDKFTPDEVFENSRTVAPFYRNDLAYTKGHHGVFLQQDSDSVMVRWAAEDSRTLTEVNVAAVLHKDGTIQFLYGDGNLDGDPVVGISKGDGQNFVYSEYTGSSIMSFNTTIEFVPNPHDDAKVKLYYRYRYPTGPGAWVDSGVQVDSVFEGMAFYPPYGAGTYDFYTVGIDEAGNTEAAPAEADLTVIFDDQRPEPPTNIQATSDEDAVFVQWEPTVSPDVSGYRVYYGDSADLDGSDAGEGDSPIEVPRLNEFKLTNLEPGKPLYVTVTSIDRVGNESGRPSGASFMLPREVRVVGTLAAGDFDHPQIIDDSLIVREDTSYGASYHWYDMRIPASPSLILKTDQLTAPIVNGTTLFHQDGHLYDGVRKYEIFNYGTINFINSGYLLAGDIDFIAPEILVASEYGTPFSWESVRTDGVGIFKVFGGQSRGLVAEADRFFVVEEGYCSPMCIPAKLHSYEYDEDLGMLVANGEVFGPPRTPNTFALSSGYLALGIAEYPPEIQVLDVNDPLNVTEVGIYEGFAHSMLRWAGDRLIGMDANKLSFYDFGDPASLVLESSVAPSMGRPSELLLHGAMGIATGDDGMAAVEFGELLPFDVTGRSASMSGDIKAIVSAGRYIYVSDGTSLNVYRGDNLSEGSPQLVGTYTPFSATNMLVEGKYLFATKGQDLSIFDISSPGSPLLVGQYIDPYSNDGDDDWVNPMAIVGTTLLTSGRAYDISDPLNPVTKYETWQHRFSNFRGDGKYIYSSSWEHGNIQVWSPTDKGLKQLAYYGPITNVEDMALDDNILYAYQVAHPPCCSGGSAWAQLTILDASNPAELKFIQSYPIAPLDGGGAGAARMIAKRGFVYMIERSQLDSTISLIQIDLRDPYAPQIALRITDQDYGSLQPPLAITPDNYVLVKSGSSFEALRITTNVPVFESFAAGTSGVRHVVAGGRYVYYAGGNQIKEVERRAPALKLSLSGSGQVAITKKGMKLQVFDPPGVPATEIVADGTIDLTDPQYDTMQELCNVLDASSRLTCTLDISGAVPSADLIDAYGMRIKPGETPSLRAQKVRRTLNLPGGIVINDLQYSNDRLFAVASEPMPGPAAIEGLYVIDPYTMSASYHDLGEPMQGTQAFSLVLRGTNAYIGSQGKVITYNWAKRTLGAAVNTISPSTEVRHMAVNHDLLFFIDRQFAGMDYESLLQVYGGAFSGNIAFGSQGSRNLGPVVVKGLAALTKDWVAISTDMGVSLYQRQGGTIVDNFMTNESYDYVSSVNGKLLLGKGSRLEIVEAVTLPLETTIQRSIFSPGPVKDVAVYGDMLAIAADSGGGVIFRLK